MASALRSGQHSRRPGPWLTELPMELTVKLLLFALCSSSFVSAEPARCSDDPVWKHLSWGNLDPCQVAETYLQQPLCSGNSTSPFAPPESLSDSAFPAYLGPTANEANNCTCYYGLYNVFSACAACQQNSASGVVVNWIDEENWVSSCGSIPANSTAFAPFVPIWARDQDEGKLFDINAALILDAGEPVTTLLATSTHAFSTSTSTSSSTRSSSTSSSSTERKTTVSPTALGAVDSGASHAGQVAGAVIGSLVLLGLVVLGIFIWFSRRRKRKQTAPSADYADDDAPPPFLLQEIASHTPPPFTPGNFSQALYEKIRGSDYERI
ncbi:hypothetical protein SISNIDRAFT_448006 [Sistotremastrum niveocremeum HHB9708]|uniref:Mid2 domain-containing protein n=1 Tax=Sistotremastrum niveocremeum HHB9708 TaxID=1314777 RepID=A0A165AKA4_9AGAM|nr:hypothetical protein SISNIDRAFT_448006 [Sistotremastrum niveocremeum HHB9708]